MLTDFAWVKQNLHCVPAKSKTANGLTYSLNQEKYLRSFLEEIPRHMDEHGVYFCEDLLPWSDTPPVECRKQL